MRPAHCRRSLLALALPVSLLACAEERRSEQRIVPEAADWGCQVDEYSDEYDWNCSENYTYNNTDMGLARHDGNLTYGLSGSRAQSQLDDDASGDLVVTVGDDGIEVETLVDDEHAEIELRVLGNDQLALFTNGNTGEVIVSCPGFDSFADSLLQTGASRDAGCGGASTLADQTMGCFLCAEVGSYLGEDTVYRGLFRAENLEKLGRFHILMEQTSAIGTGQVSDQEGAVADAIATALEAVAAVLRVVFKEDETDVDPTVGDEGGWQAGSEGGE